jgi:hypothetical protein
MHVVLIYVKLMCIFERLCFGYLYTIIKSFSKKETRFYFKVKILIFFVCLTNVPDVSFNMTYIKTIKSDIMIRIQTSIPFYFYF